MQNTETAIYPAASVRLPGHDLTSNVKLNRICTKRINDKYIFFCLIHKKKKTT
jgi:hypothetical protein